MEDMTVFNNPAFGKVRVVVIDAAPWFVGKDVAVILGYAKPLNALAMHVDKDDSLKQGIADSLGRKQKTILINESGLYSLILSSKLPKAKAFKHWVTSEVLPSIRKTGSYSVKQVIPKLTPQPHYKARMVKTAIRDVRGTSRPITNYRYALFARSRHFIILHGNQHKHGL